MLAIRLHARILKLSQFYVSNLEDDMKLFKG